METNYSRVLIYKLVLMRLQRLTPIRGRKLHRRIYSFFDICKVFTKINPDKGTETYDTHFSLLLLLCLQRLTPIRGRKRNSMRFHILCFNPMFTKINPDKGTSLLVTLGIGYKKSNHLILQTVAFLFCCFIKFT